MATLSLPCQQLVCPVGKTLLTRFNMKWGLSNVLGQEPVSRKLT